MEREFMEMLDEVYGDGYALLLKNGDPIAFEVGLRDFEREY